ncbi:Phthiocerol/phenolphthiocerol synthesis polyketide synthase type I PpsE [Dyella sp. AD56]|uniref:acyltransferase domain-containing protein n=1 Tax=Dyella sp. AD56 TaxID=1528744 RepID=UPI000C85EA57|nr:acyltransferase domain-containing protein [Dyella sp. AD56]PMQ03812.1 Phthiocerol/phenolphthiocerol synthesis polyketide synthase type I PpsE [Dyella sp. AD56]
MAVFDVAASPWHFLPLSAATTTSLAEKRLNLAEILEADALLDIADLAYTMQISDHGLDDRLAVLGCNNLELVKALRDGSGAGWISGCGSTMARPVAFLFPGVGEQYVNMGKDLYSHAPEFREDMDYCFDRLDRELEADLRTAMFVEGWIAPTRQQAWLRGASAPHEPVSELNRTLYAQPAMFVIEYCLARQLMRWGVLPTAVLGYSLGELVAATIAGVVSIEDALRIVAGRAKLIDELPPGAMLAIPMAASEVAPLLADELSIGISNGPKLCVVSGANAAIAELAAAFAAIGVATRQLSTTHAFHSPFMKPAADGLRSLLKTIELRQPNLRCLSNVTGTWLTDAEATDPEYWLRHLCQTAKFAECLDTLLDSEEDWAMAEVGPGQSLAALVRQRAALLPGDRGQLVVPTMRSLYDCEDDRLVLMLVLARLWVAGSDPDWAKFHAGACRQRVSSLAELGIVEDQLS